MTLEDIQAFNAQADALIKYYGLEAFAKFLNMSVRGVQYWFEDPPKKPQRATMHRVRELFLTHTSGKNLLQLHENETDKGFKDRYIQSLEKENARLEKQNADLQKDFDLSLGELRHNILLTRAIAETTQELAAEFQAGKNKKMLEQILDSASIRNVERYKKLKEEGNFAYVGK